MAHVHFLKFLNRLSPLNGVYMCMDGEVFIGIIYWGLSWSSFLKNTGFPSTISSQLSITSQLGFNLMSLFSIHAWNWAGLIFCRSSPCTDCVHVFSVPAMPRKYHIAKYVLYLWIIKSLIIVFYYDSWALVGGRKKYDIDVLFRVEFSQFTILFTLTSCKSLY